ncbi:sterol desaturase family protein [Pyxidicoccus sp. MSG2]|uniref:sterol desaturase family protein n=1 Tax=Pyxidicoccus sp. MSG2 TaxID=2996790 RepID=UPI0022718BE4|nr:sterol desaturase family protein [Pyxidicoccus sp. MSG2]MCY1021337.1 GNAT family N-acetyltransferase [Pyxidicoccus sp. MSG2]
MDTKTYVLYALPIFFAPVAIDLASARLKGVSRYRLNDLLANLMLAILGILVGLVLTGATLWVYTAVQRYAPFQLAPGDVTTWLLAFIVYDCLYYWGHRAHHEVALLWAFHSVHHSGEDMNFGLALRQSILGEATSWPFFIPMALLGIAPEVYLGVAGLQLAYQYTLHNTWVPALGRVERLLVTPSQHRVHHSRNRPYIDKNYGNILVLWDRLFGSYQPELADHPPVYGVRHGIRSWSPLTINFLPFAELFRKARACRGLVDGLLCLVKGPAWQPASLRSERFMEADDGPSASFRKYDPPLSPRVAVYCAAQCAALVGLSAWVLWNLGALSGGVLLAAGVLVAANALTLGGLLEGRRGCWHMELFRLAGVVLAALLVAGTSARTEALTLVSYAALSAAWLTGFRNDFLSGPPGEEPLELQWLSSLEALGQEMWDACFPREDVLQSFALHRAVEAARLPGIEFHHLLARREGRALAVIPCFRINLSLTTVAPEAIKKAAAAVRRVFPGFLCTRAFIVGTPVAICRDLLGVRPGPEGQLPADVLRAVTREVLARARRLRLGLVVIKELTSRLLPQVRDVLSESFTLVESPATTWLYVGEPGAGDYRERLRKKYRSLMTHRQRQLVEGGMRWELRHDFAPYAERMEALYLQVLGRSKVRFETLNRDFFVELSRRLGERAFALLCFQGEALVAFELFLEDAGEVHPLYLGLDYQHRDEGALYFNCIYKIVEMSEARGKAVVELGQTSYPAKASIGAVVDRLYLAVRHLNPFIQLVLRVLRRVLFPPTPVPRRQRVFRDMRANDEALLRHGVHFEDALS